MAVYHPTIVYVKIIELLLMCVTAGEYHLYVEEVQLGRLNEFECQVSPDHQNQHQPLRARATLNVLGRWPTEARWLPINQTEDKRV